MPDVVFAPSVPAALHEAVLKAPHFRRWLARMESGFDLRGVTVRDAVPFGTENGGGRMGFILVEADAWHDGRRAPGIALLRGDSVCVLLVLRSPGAPERTVLTREARVPVGCPGLLSLPAGMLDGGEFVSTALRELAEEVGEDLPVTRRSLVELTTVWLSPGGCDEAIGLYYAVLDVSEALIARLEGRRRGVSAEHEDIRLEIVALDDLPRIGTTDAKTLLSYHLYKALISAPSSPAA